MGGKLDVVLLLEPVDTAYCYVLSSGHLVAHEVLKDDTDIPMEIFQGVLPKVDAVQQNLSLGGIVEAGDEFDHGCLALAVLPNQRDSFSR